MTIDHFLIFNVSKYPLQDLIILMSVAHETPIDYRSFADNQK